MIDIRVRQLAFEVSPRLTGHEAVFVLTVVLMVISEAYALALVVPS